jgi:antitoxin VapB
VSDHPFQPVAFEPIGRDDLNACLSTWKHRMGELRRPTRGWNHGLRHGGELVVVVATDTLIRPRVAGFDRHQAIELSRLCALRPDICRVALRLWRLFVFPVVAQERGCIWAISYQDSALHSGNLYRFDGWVRLGVSRSGVDPRTGRRGRSKVIWGWCEDPVLRRRARPFLPEEGLTCDRHGAVGRHLSGISLL